MENPEHCQGWHEPNRGQSTRVFFRCKCCDPRFFTSLFIPFFFFWRGAMLLYPHFCTALFVVSPPEQCLNIHNVSWENLWQWPHVMFQCTDLLQLKYLYNVKDVVCGRLWHVAEGEARVQIIKLMMAEFHLAAPVSASWCFLTHLSWLSATPESNRAIESTEPNAISNTSAFSLYD